MLKKGPKLGQNWTKNTTNEAQKFEVVELMKYATQKLDSLKLH